MPNPAANPSVEIVLSMARSIVNDGFPGLLSFTLTAAALAVSGNTTYTLQDSLGAEFSPGTPVTITGFTNPTNNGTFTVQASTAGVNLIVNNPAGVLESNTGIARSLIQGAGRILTDTNVNTLRYLNMAIAELQDQLASHGVSVATAQVRIPGTPAALTTNDPTILPFIGYNGYSADGTGDDLDTTWVLPQDLLIPWTVSERQNGTINPFIKMNVPEDGIYAAVIGSRRCQWEFRTGNIYFLQSYNPVDLLIRYESRLPFVLMTDDFNTTTIPIPGCVNALAHMVARIYARARGSAQTAQLDQAVSQYLYLMFNRSARANQRRTFRRGSFSQGNRQGWSVGAWY